MMTEIKKRITFVAVTYSLFWIMILITGIVMMWVGEGLPSEIMMVVCSWAPTVALLVSFKKLFPDSTVKRFYKNAFQQPLRGILLVFSTIAQVLVFTCAVGITAITNKVSIHMLVDVSGKAILTGIVMTLIQGATGEESGWRGFLQPSFEKDNSVMKSSFIIGLIWGFWHLPLWLISGYTGVELLRYIAAFMVAILSTSMIIGVCYFRCKNLFVPMWIHFIFNFVFSIFTGNESYLIDFFTWLAALYVLMAVGYAVWHKKCNRMA